MSLGEKLLDYQFLITILVISITSAYLILTDNFNDPRWHLVQDYSIGTLVVLVLAILFVLAEPNGKAKSKEKSPSTACQGIELQYYPKV